MAALRPLIDYSGELAKWRVNDPIAVFRSVSNETVKKLLIYAQEYGRKPNAVGKNALVWSSLYEKVENECLKVALSEAKAAKN